MISPNKLGIYSVIFLMQDPASDKIKQERLIYVADPMCSWCYGFAPVIHQIKNDYDWMEFHLIMGGLRPFGKETMKSLKNFLTHHWNQVERRCGQPFRKGILDREDLKYDTEPASRAVVTILEIDPHQAMAMLSSIQTAFYYENQDPTSEKALVDLVENLGVGRDAFLSQYRSDDMKDKTMSHFKQARELGVTGFPATLIADGEKITHLSYGYSSAANLRSKIEAYTA